MERTPEHPPEGEEHPFLPGSAQKIIDAQTYLQHIFVETSSLSMRPYDYQIALRLLSEEHKRVVNAMTGANKPTENPKGEVEAKPAAKKRISTNNGPIQLDFTHMKYFGWKDRWPPEIIASSGTLDITGQPLLHTMLVWYKIPNNMFVRHWHEVDDFFRSNMSEFTRELSARVKIKVEKGYHIHKFKISYESQDKSNTKHEVMKAVGAVESLIACCYDRLTHFKRRRR